MWRQASRELVLPASSQSRLNGADIVVEVAYFCVVIAHLLAQVLTI